MPSTHKKTNLKNFLNTKAKLYNNPSFIAHDPICIPHRFQQKQDIEIAALFAATLAWGNRTTIINKAKELMQRMDDKPHAFVLHHSDEDLKNLMSFKHRTFNGADLLYFILFLKEHYKKYDSLEEAFVQEYLSFPSLQRRGFPKPVSERGGDAALYLNNFYKNFFSLPHEKRTEKHIAAPFKNSACKRLNMFLRWMVRQDENKVDFGIWKKIKPSQLICPIDVHVARVAHQLQLIKNNKANWQTAIELTSYLRTLDANDPVKYDFALFGLGVNEKLK